MVNYIIDSCRMQWWWATEIQNGFVGAGYFDPVPEWDEKRSHDRLWS